MTLLCCLENCLFRGLDGVCVVLLLYLKQSCLLFFFLFSCGLFGSVHEGGSCKRVRIHRVELRNKESEEGLMK